MLAASPLNKDTPPTCNSRHAGNRHAWTKLFEDRRDAQFALTMSAKRSIVSSVFRTGRGLAPPIIINKAIEPMSVAISRAKTP